MDLPTRLDLFALGRDYIVTRAKRIDPRKVDVAGSDANIFVGSQSMVAAHIIKQLAYSIARLFLDGAEQEDLDRYAWDRYRLTRKGASSALGRVRFYRANASLGAGTILAGTKLRTQTGIEYVTTSNATFGVADLESSADVRAVQAGKTTQVGANYIRAFADTGALFDRTIQVTNDAATSGGEEAEEDDLFRERIRDFWRTARRGTLGAIEFGAKTVEGVVSAQAIEALGEGGLPARVVTLYISDSSGVASDALAAKVRTALDEYRAGGIAVLVRTAVPQIVDVVLRLTFKANIDTVALTELVRAAVVEYVNSLAVNATLHLAELYAVLERFRSEGLVVTTDSIVAPAGDVVPTVGRTLRTTLSNVTAPLALVA